MRVAGYRSGARLAILTKLEGGAEIFEGLGSLQRH
jgi:hypothetical protein